MGNCQELCAVTCVNYKYVIMIFCSFLPNYIYIIYISVLAIASCRLYVCKMSPLLKIHRVSPQTVNSQQQVTQIRLFVSVHVLVTSLPQKLSKIVFSKNSKISNICKISKISNISNIFKNSTISNISKVPKFPNISMLQSLTIWKFRKRSSGNPTRYSARGQFSQIPNTSTTGIFKTQCVKQMVWGFLEFQK